MVKLDVFKVFGAEVEVWVQAVSAQELFVQEVFVRRLFLQTTIPILQALR